MGQTLVSPDMELARAVRSGNKKAWDALATSYGGLVRSTVADYLSSLVASPSENEISALTFEVFNVLASSGFGKLKEYTGKSSLASFLAVSAVLYVQDFIRREFEKGRFQNLFRDVEGTLWCPSDKESDLDKRGLSEDLDKALDGLEPAEALVLRLFYFHALEYEDISALLGMNIGSVTRTLQSARSRLADALDGNLDDYLY